MPTSEVWINITQLWPRFKTDRITTHDTEVHSLNNSKIALNIIIIINTGMILWHNILITRIDTYNECNLKC
jgi:hypothetical protein